MKQLRTLMLFAAASIFAGDQYWLNPATADWTAPAAWQNGTVPSPADNVWFRYQADTTVTATQNMNIYRGYVNGKGVVTFDFDPGVVMLSSNNFAISQGTPATGARTLHIKSGILDLNTTRVFYMGDGTLLGTNALVLSSANSIVRNGSLQAGTWSCNNAVVVSNGASLVNIGLTIGNNWSSSNNLFLVSGAVVTNMTGLTVGHNGSGNLYLSENGSFFMTTAANKDFLLGNNASATGNVAVLRNSFMTNVYQLACGFKGQRNMTVLSNSQMFVTYTAKAGADSETVPLGSSDNAVLIHDGSLLYAANSVWLGDNVRGDSNGRNRFEVKGAGSRLVTVGGVTIGGKCSDNRLDVSDGGSVVCTNGNIVVGYGNMAGTDLYGCNRNVFTVTNGTIELGTTLTVGAAAFVGCASSDSLGDIASNSVVNTRGSSNLNGRYPGLIVGQSVRTTNSVLCIGSGSVFTNAYAVMIGFEGFRSRLIVDHADLVANGGQSVIGEYATGSEGALVLINQARFINNSASRFYVGVNGPANRFALTNAVHTGISLGMGSNASASNNVLSAKDSQISLTSVTILGDWGQKNLIDLDNSQLTTLADLTVGYQTASTGNVVRLSGRNPLLRADSLSLRNGAVLEFEVPKTGYAQVPIQCTAASAGSSNLTFQAANVWLKVSGKEFQQAGGGWVVLATNLNKTMSGSISLANCDLPEGSTLVNSAQYIAVRLPSTGGTVLRLY